MKENVNRLWFDALLRHQIYAIRASGSLRDSVNEILKKTEADIDAWIRSALEGDTAYTPKRLAKAQQALKRIRAVRMTAWNKADKVLFQDAADFIQNDAQFLSKALETVVPVVLETSLPSPASLKGIVQSSPFEGRTLKEWASSLRAADLRRIEDQVKIGLVRGEPGPDIARRIVGSVAKNGMDGATQITRNNAQAITRTAVNHFSNSAREAFLAENSDLFTEEIFAATLDSRTTPICRSLDGQRFPVGEGQIPPLHFGCRSIRVASINGDALGSRPAKPFTERQLVREFAKQEGLGDITTRDALPRGMKGQFDSFSSRRIREMTQVVPAKIKYQDWLKSQSAEFQDDTLGVTRGALFRRGGLKLDRFVDRAGDQIPLADLAVSDASAFRAAGLDPGRFYR